MKIEKYKGIILFPYPVKRDDITNKKQPLTKEQLIRRIDWVIWNRKKIAS